MAVLARTRDFLIRRELLVWDATKRRRVPLTGRTDLTVMLSASAGGASVSGFNAVTLAENPAGSGIYEGTIDRANLEGATGLSDGQQVYLVFDLPGDDKISQPYTWAAAPTMQPGGSSD